MKKRLALCSGRHFIPEAEGSVFDHAVNPLDVEGLEQEARFVLRDCTELDLFVTGLTVACVAVINACRERGIKLTLWHYDRERNEYYPQNVK
ncbi:MAG: hypothetical protein ACI4WS_02655 [Oscillospiraceae bacterium]